ncbi:hypothetical protein [Catalinimonas niigatensis]|uniref:hypothetical protein n=1 Tax=Catalinimonas niigatensis TaxID=1397264 RepID=UPI0026661103|nr:hypothetical protein [Catalinimonas niigatensis]WPP49798.1 hypothetical protein PZB72_24305 [Catalinimonas niigatensis]
MPKDLMLDQLIFSHNVPQDSLYQAARLLAQFYYHQSSLYPEPTVFISNLKENLEKNFEELASFTLPFLLKRSILTKQQLYLSAHHLLFEKRISQGCIKEVHGDLRPEHICLKSPPVIIDCLEFNAALRSLDIADELAYFSVECEAFNASWIPPFFWSTYQAVNGDDVPGHMRNFYKSYRAVLRALLAIRHTMEKNYRDKQHYLAQTLAYLQLAEKYSLAL